MVDGTPYLRAHDPTDAVKWWNTKGRQYGTKSKEVRKWMLDPDNYTLDHYAINRSAGAKLNDRYLPPKKVRKDNGKFTHRLAR